MNFGLRYYQREAGNEFFRGMNDHQRQVVVLPTGTGKTVLGLAIAKRIFGNGRTLWIAHRDELISQPYDTCASVWPEARRGIVKARRDEHDAQIVFASIQTICRPKRAERLGSFDFVVLDECHHSTSASWKRAADEIGCFDPSGPRLLGLTATPERTDNQRLDAIFDRVAYVYHLHTAIADEYLVPVRYEQRKIDIDLSAVKTKKNGDFDDTDLDVKMIRAGVVSEICSAVAANMSKKSLVFVPSVDQADAVAAKLIEAGIPSASISGKTPVELRRARLRRLGTGDLRCVVNCAVLIEGFDEPTIDCIIMARPTKSKPLYQQAIGRGLRPHAPTNKSECLVVDMVGASAHHGLVTAPVLFGSDVDVEKEIRRAYEFDPDVAEFNERKLLLGQIKGLQPIVRSNLRWVQCGDGSTIAISAGAGGTVIARMCDGRWSVIVAKQNDTEALVVNASLELAQGIAEDYVRRCEVSGLADKGARWRAEKATPKQIAALEKMKEKIHGQLSRGEASDLITQRVATDWRHMPATPKQIAALSYRGIEYDPGITRQKARRLLHG